MSPLMNNEFLVNLVQAEWCAITWSKLATFEFLFFTISAMVIPILIFALESIAFADVDQARWSAKNLDTIRSILGIDSEVKNPTSQQIELIREKVQPSSPTTSWLYRGSLITTMASIAVSILISGFMVSGAKAGSLSQSQATTAASKVQTQTENAANNIALPGVLPAIILPGSGVGRYIVELRRMSFFVGIVYIFAITILILQLPKHENRRVRGFLWRCSALLSSSTVVWAYTDYVLFAI